MTRRSSLSCSIENAIGEHKEYNIFMTISMTVLIIAVFFTALILFAALFALHHSKFDTVFKGIFLYMFIFLTIPFCYWLQTPIIRTFVWMANANLWGMDYACVLLEENLCIAREDCQLILPEIEKGTKYTCAPK